MKPETQRIAIAEACNWELVEMDEDTHYCLVVIDDSLAELDPLKDLNVMHEAEKVLTPEQRLIYCEILSIATHTNKIYGPPKYWFSCFHSTASERAEAFLRTIGKWEES